MATPAAASFSNVLVTGVPIRLRRMSFKWVSRWLACIPRSSAIRTVSEMSFKRPKTQVSAKLGHELFTGAGQPNANNWAVCTKVLNPALSPFVSLLEAR